MENKKRSRAFTVTSQSDASRARESMPISSHSCVKSPVDERTRCTPSSVGDAVNAWPPELGAARCARLARGRARGAKLTFVAATATVGAVDGGAVSRVGGATATTCCAAGAGAGYVSERCPSEPESDAAARRRRARGEAGEGAPVKDAACRRPNCSRRRRRSSLRWSSGHL